MKGKQSLMCTTNYHGEHSWTVSWFHFKLYELPATQFRRLIFAISRAVTVVMLRLAANKSSGARQVITANIHERLCNSISNTNYFARNLERTDGQSMVNHSPQGGNKITPCSKLKKPRMRSPKSVANFIHIDTHPSNNDNTAMWVWNGTSIRSIIKSGFFYKKLVTAEFIKYIKVSNLQCRQLMQRYVWKPTLKP